MTNDAAAPTISAARGGTGTERHDVIILGAGAAGLSAALMLGRSRRRVLVIDGQDPRNRVAPHMHGVLSRDGLPPLELLRLGRSEAEGYGVRILNGMAVEVRRDATTRPSDGSGDFLVTLADGSEHRGRRLLAATGLRDELPVVEGLAEHWGEGAVACPYCDGWESRDARIGVILSSPKGLHQAQLLRQLSEHVTVFSALAAPLDGDARRSLSARGIRLEEKRMTRVRGARGALEGVELDDGTLVELDRLFVGAMPRARDGLLAALGAEYAEGPMGPWLRVGPGGASSVPGLWAAGNAADPSAFVALAMGQGAQAGAGINADLVAEEIRIAVGEASGERRAR